MSNFTDSYDPIAVVEFTHHILHLDSHFQQVDHTFNISYNSFYNDYTKSLIPIPAICAGLGLLAVIVLQISLCARLCCECCRFMPRQHNERNRRAAQTSLFSQKPARYQNYVYLFVVGFVITVLAVQSFIIGKSFLTSGVHSSKNTVNFVLDVFNDLVSYGDKMTSYGDQLSEDFTFAQNTGCTQASNLQQYMPEYYNYISEYESYVTPVPNQLDDVSSKLELWGVTYQNYTIWGLYFIILIGLVVYLLGFWRKSKIAMRIGIGMTELIIIFLFLLIGAEMFIVMGFSDFCMDPVSYVPPLVPTDIRNITTYYTTCTGVNPVQSIVSQAETFVGEYEIAIKAVQLQPNCAGNSYLTDALSVLRKVDVTLVNITTELACPPTQSQLVNLLENGLCDKVFKGVYTIWIGQYFSTGSLLFTTIVIALIYQYFGSYWDQREDPDPLFDNYAMYQDDTPDSGIRVTTARVTVVNPAMATTVSPIPTAPKAEYQYDP